MIADGQGRAIGFTLAPGQAHEPPLATGLLDLLPEAPLWIVGDRGLASHAFRRIRSIGARPVIPSKRNEEPVACTAWIYANRTRVERLRSRLKEWRAVPTRYRETACSIMGVLWSTAAIDWAKS